MTHEQLDRLRAMSSPDQQDWDLSLKDEAAIRAAVEEIERLRAEPDPVVRVEGDDLVYSLGRFSRFRIGRDTDWDRLRAIVDDAERRSREASRA